MPNLDLDFNNGNMESFNKEEAFLCTKVAAESDRDDREIAKLGKKEGCEEVLSAKKKKKKQNKKKLIMCIA